MATSALQAENPSPTGTLTPNASSTNLVSANTAPVTASMETNTPPVTTMTLTSQSPASQEALTAGQKQLATPMPPSMDLTTHTGDHLTEDTHSWMGLAALMTLGSMVGFLLYQSGLTRAKNCGHSATLLVVGVIFGIIGYWAGGFAVQTGGVGDAHAALAAPIPYESKSSLDHELGFMAGGHHWGLMGSSGFFLTTDSNSANSAAAVFLTQAALLAIAVAAALGAALERGRLSAMAIFAFIVGALIYPFFANWVWGGGWLAELGREFGLGHGFVDTGGAAVIHLTAGTLALVIAIVLGPRLGRFGNAKKLIPGHNAPFILLGAIILVISWMGTNEATAPSNSGLAAGNTLLAAAGGLLISFFLAGWQRRKPEPALLCRGLLGGAVAASACSPLIDPWAAFVIGGFAGLFIQGAMSFFEKLRLDDPVGAAATHGVGGAWGVIATGFFANGTAGPGLNGIDGPVKGLFFGGAWHQLAAQAIGAATGFVVVFILGYACLLLIQKIVGIRVSPAEEAEGVDWSQTGVLGYQGDTETDSKS